MDDRKLKEYALNIYNNIAGYSLQKAFTLFPKYYPKIAFYYSELITKKQEELTARTIQSVGITRAHTLVRFSRETNFTMKKLYVSNIALMRSLNKKVKEMEFNVEYSNYDYLKLLEIASYKIDVIKTHSYIIDNVISLASLNNQAFKKIIDEAKMYGFSDILKEAKYYLAANRSLLGWTKDASKRYIERLNIH